MAMLVLTGMIAMVLAGAWSLGRAVGRAGPVHGVDTVGDQAVTVAPGWAVEAFGPQQAFELARRGQSVVGRWRDEVGDQLREASESLRSVAVVHVQAHSGAPGRGRLTMVFEDGTELDAGSLDSEDTALELAWVAGRTGVELVSLDIQGPVVVVVAECGGRRYEVRARELDVRR